MDRSFQHMRPERVSFTDWISKQRMCADFIDLIKHVLLPYSIEPKEPAVKLDLNVPPGSFDSGHLLVCQEIYNNVESRRNTLEQKGSMLLTLVSFIMPLVISRP